MRKIHLHPESLVVDSFVASGTEAGAHGTVLAHDAPPLTQRNCPITSGPTCQTNCDCTLGCPSIAPCTELF
jgi:hypothetical protein